MKIKKNQLMLIFISGDIFQIELRELAQEKVDLFFPESECRYVDQESNR